MKFRDAKAGETIMAYLSDAGRNITMFRNDNCAGIWATVIESRKYTTVLGWKAGEETPDAFFDQLTDAHKKLGFVKVATYCGDCDCSPGPNCSYCEHDCCNKK